MDQQHPAGSKGGLVICFLSTNAAQNLSNLEEGRRSTLPPAAQAQIQKGEKNEGQGAKEESLSIGQSSPSQQKGMQAQGLLKQNVVQQMDQKGKSDCSSFQVEVSGENTKGKCIECLGKIQIGRASCRERVLRLV